jgi:hypothetical protein
VNAQGDGSSGQARRPTRGRGGARNVDPEALEVVELRLAALEPQAQETQIGRNLWQFYTPPRPAPPPPIQRPQPVRPPPPPPPPPELPPENIVVLPTIKFRYLGSFGPKARPIAVLEDGELIINALEGDVVQDEFIVERIGYESIYIAYKNHPDEPAKQLEIGG